MKCPFCNSDLVGEGNNLACSRMACEANALGVRWTGDGVCFHEEVADLEGLKVMERAMRLNGGTLDARQ